MSMPTISLQKIIDKFKLEVLYTPKDPQEIFIQKNVTNRPGLPLAGFFDYFESERIQIIGTTEYTYLEKLEDDVRKEHIRALFAYQPPALIYTHGMPADAVVRAAAEEFAVPLLSMEGNTSQFTAALTAYLSVQLAPTITRHGVLVEVYGEGILIVGDSGVGKSETAIELIERGHRLIADDAVELRRVSAETIVGSAPELIRHYIELRGIGIIDVRRIFGMGAVKDTEKINLVVEFEPWEQGKMYERLGMDENYTDILGIKIPSLTVPIKPGRNLAVILEIAAMNNRQKRMGYNTALEFNKKLMGQMEEGMM